MQIANIRPIAVRPRSDQPNGYEVDIQVEWMGSSESWVVISSYYSVVSVPLTAAPNATTDRIAAEGLLLFRSALNSTEPSDVQTTLELAIGHGGVLEEAS